MSKILAIDTSTDACSAALLVNQKIIERFEVSPQQHTELILPMVSDLLHESKLNLKQLDAIAFGNGPGSFTGVRLAASIVQGLAFAANIPVIKISTLRALAQEVFAELAIPKIVVAQDAKMQEIYWGEYQANNHGIMQAIKPDKLVKPTEIGETAADCFGVGSGFTVYRDAFIKLGKIRTISKQYVQAKYIAQLAEYDFNRGVLCQAEDALPVYLREKVTGMSS